MIIRGTWDHRVFGGGTVTVNVVLDTDGELLDASYNGEALEEDDYVDVEHSLQDNLALAESAGGDCYKDFLDDQKTLYDVEYVIRSEGEIVETGSVQVWAGDEKDAASLGHQKVCDSSPWASMDATINTTDVSEAEKVESV